ncbi:hypothetical protein CPB84DRAFT_174092 [Gymnopilus junonius]|uniref:Uncharacterized protein n=1 Tax=Gymnopilus junonius TaxID=109634 RepID=A0A9P5TJ85_GYMJU|nr:hypothetical protein CPB84DRAFT_174092 [Gymnopilus junonius]
MPFNEERKPVNLGGISSSTSLRQALDQVKLQRLDRATAKRRNQAALKLQSWWRLLTAQQFTRSRCREVFDADPSSLTASRSLIFLPNDADRLYTWSSALIGDEGLLLLQRVASDERSSWLIVIRQTLRQILRFIAESPTSPYTSIHLHSIGLVLDPPQGFAGFRDSERADITSYVLKAGYYRSLCKVITSLTKNVAPLSVLIQLIFFPLRFLRECVDKGAYTKALVDFTAWILPIPQIASRLEPLSERFAVDFSFFVEGLELLDPFLSQIIPRVTLQFGIHSLSNLMLFMHPRYPRLSTASYDAYLHLICVLVTSVPDPALPGSSGDAHHGSWTDFSRKIDNTVIPHDLDVKTRRRLNTVLSTKHIVKLLNAANCPSKLLSLATYLPFLCWLWPSQVRNAVNAVVTGGFARTLYTAKISDIPLGKNAAVNPIKMIGSESFVHWAHLLFFTDLFMLLNEQINDEEFYRTISIPERESSPWIPLEVDEFRSFLKQLCSVVYVLDRLPALEHQRLPLEEGLIGKYSTLD